MKDFNKMMYFPIAEKLVKILQTKTQNSNPLFFRIITAFYFSMITSHMRVNIKGWTGRDTIPINMYALALANSGSGKGHSTSVIENSVINNFKEVFTQHTFVNSAENHCQQLSIKRANLNGTDQQTELDKLAKDFNSLGALLFSFDDATTPAIKQMRQKLLMAKAGSANLIIDEIGANFIARTEPMITYLELYDKGLLKDKLVKSSSENVRFERINGYTPANLLMFGTPSKLLDGARTEESFLELLEMGYARRLFFGFSEKPNKNLNISIQELKQQLFNNSDDDYLEELSEHIGELADMVNLDKTLLLSDEAIDLLLTYKLDCEKRSTDISDTEIIKKSELEHRYSKVMKLAGAYAFIDKKDTITPTYVEYAIKLAEDSGEAFSRIISPQRPYMKIANYLASTKGEVTLADLDEDLPCFRGSKAQKEELITMATAWGYKNNIIIKKTYLDSILFLHADSIEETNLDKLIVTYSTDMTQGYYNDIISWDNLAKLVTMPDYHWLNHHVIDGYRKEENCMTGFNLLVLDIDGTCPITTAQLLLKGYKAIYYTTKRHTEETNRYRIILPINYTVKLDAKDYKELYNNVINHLPFEIDESTSHRSKKWLTHKGNIIVTDGELFDILPFIPKSAKNDKRIQRYEDQSNLDGLERWVLDNMGEGSRNNMLLRYALILMDKGYNYFDIKEKVDSLNNKLPNKLEQSELDNTIFQTLANRLSQQGRLAS